MRLWRYWTNLATLAGYHEEWEGFEMPIIAMANGAEYELCPEGLHSAVCVDVVDRKVIETTYGPKHKIDIIWQVLPVDEDGAELRDSRGKRFEVMSRYTLSLNEKSMLYAHLKSWRGRKFSPEEIKQGFDVEKLIGANCQLQVVHNPGSKDASKTYANVQSIVPPARGVKLVPENFTRVQDREARTPEPEQIAPQSDPSDADLGF